MIKETRSVDPASDPDCTHNSEEPVIQHAGICAGAARESGPYRDR